MRRLCFSCWGCFIRRFRRFKRRERRGGIRFRGGRNSRRLGSGWLKYDCIRIFGRGMVQRIITKKSLRYVKNCDNLKVLGRLQIEIESKCFRRSNKGQKCVCKIGDQKRGEQVFYLLINFPLLRNSKESNQMMLYSI